MKFVLECINCGTRYNAEEVHYLCPNCSSKNSNETAPQGVLKTIYSYQKIKKLHPMFKSLEADCFIELLPVMSLKSLSYLNVGNTPCYRFSIPASDSPDHELFLKDDSQNPTFSYKDRASSIVCAIASEKGIDTIIAASTGNAGSSLAGIGASLQQSIIILVPKDAPRAKLLQAMMYGAMVIPVDGDYDMAFDLSVKITNEMGIYNRNTAFNPYTIEGKKTASFEIYSQLEENIPDTLFVSSGDGCILAGIYKGWEDLLELGYIKKIPRIIAVQAEGSSSIISNLGKDDPVFKNPHTIADSISVKIPRNFYMAKDYLLKYNGSGISVTDEEIKQSAKELAKKYGIFSEPAAAAAFAGYQKARKAENITKKSKNVVLLTGSGLKDADACKNMLNPLKTVKDFTDLTNRIKEFTRQ